MERTVLAAVEAIQVELESPWSSTCAFWKSLVMQDTYHWKKISLESSVFTDDELGGSCAGWIPRGMDCARQNLRSSGRPQRWPVSSHERRFRGVSDVAEDLASCNQTQIEVCSVPMSGRSDTLLHGHAIRCFFWLLSLESVKKAKISMLGSKARTSLVKMSWGSSDHMRGSGRKKQKIEVWLARMAPYLAGRR